MKNILFTSILLISSFGFVQVPTITWEKSFGGSSDDSAESIRQTTDGGYIIAGESESIDGDVTGNNGYKDYWVVKVDSSGNLIWEKSFGGTWSDNTPMIQETTDGGVIVAGESSSNDGDVSGNNGGSSDYWIIKLDINGNIIWQNCLGGSSTDVAYSIEQTTDGGYIVAGKSSSSDGDITGNNGNYDYWVVKLDISGNISWQKSLGGSQWDIAYSVQQTTDGGYIVAGKINSVNGDITENNGLWDYWVVKLDNIGNIIWQKSYGGSNDDYAYSIKQTSDGGYIIAGGSNSTDGDVIGSSGSGCWIVKIDSVGNIIWQKFINSFIVIDWSEPINLTVD